MKKTLAFFLLMAITGILNANNISISNLVLTGKNTGSQYTMVQFDVSWENSWRSSSAPYNWDAAWVFVKYRVAGGAWQHAWLNDAGNTAPSGSIIDVGLLTPSATFNATTNPGLGAFIYRNASGSGTFSKTSVQLRWNYGANGVADNALVDIRVFAIEMVYVPQGAFTVGSGGTETGSFTNGPWASGATLPLSIASENALTVANTAGNLWYTSTSASIGDQTGPIPATFPKGFNAFYCMKYEISQQQYVDFLNTLTQTQATARKNTTTSYRNAITGSAVGSYTTTNPFVACNYLSWNDGTAYADWAGLRPISELEFEKACRGTAAVVANEYAWGSTSITPASGITNPGLINETATNAGANACYMNAGTNGPMRTGVFATGTTTRAQAGSSYWGILELSGNLFERAVTIGNAIGRAFTGLHGNGTLTSTGEHDVTNWPAGSTASGSGQRDGAFDNGNSMLRVSDRTNASNTSTSRGYGNGFRAVRTLPPMTLAIGDNYQGGKVAYILQPGDPGYSATVQKGLIAALADQSTGIAWITGDLTQSTLNGNTLTAIGTGQANTNFMMAQTGFTGGAAKVCDDYTNTETGTGVYSDWYLPSKDELQQLYLNRIAVGGFASFDYWSSSENYSIGAWVQDFNDGSKNGILKGTAAYVRAVRSFPPLPTVTTAAVTNVNPPTASGGGNVTSDGGSAVTERGVCWSTTALPTTADSHTHDGTGTGTFTSTLTGIDYNNYYARAYATNSAGTAYGNQVTFYACFVAGTKITMADGSIKNIEDVLVGDKVKSINPETMETVSRTVLRTFAHPPSDELLRITFSNGIVNTNTKIHPYWVKGKGWSSVDPAPLEGKQGFSSVPLAVGDQCQVLENGKLLPLTIRNIEFLPNLAVPTYNFSVDETHCYFANGILVHNK